MIRIGIPRALHFLQYYPLWRTYFEELGVQLVISPPTSREILSSGAKLVADVTCLPVKVYAGHVVWLRDQGQVEMIFTPAIRSLEHGALNCAKIQGLTDIIRATVPDCPPLLEAWIDVHRYKISSEEAFYRLGAQFTRNPLKIRQAWKRAFKVYEDYQNLTVSERLTYPQALARIYPGEWPETAKATEKPQRMNVALIGHPYCLYDDYINHELSDRLRKLGVGIFTSEMVSLQEAQQGIQDTTGQKRWLYEDIVSGAGGYYLNDASNIDGVIAVLAFTCGPDSAMVETLTRHAHHLKRPFMSLVLDEHGSAAGMITRLEAFVDMLERQSAPKQTKQQSKPARTSPSTEKTKPALPNVLHHINTPRIGFPRMGSSVVPLKSLFEGIGAQVELGPALSSRTVSLGARHSPEFICTPYKYILGNMIEMIEAGADTLLYMDGAELCRNSTYTQLLNDALHDLGYKFKLVSTAIFEHGGLFALPQFLRQFMESFSWSEVLREIYLAVSKMNVLDEIERRVQYLRPREDRQGSADKIWEEGLVRVDEAKEMAQLKNARHDMLQKLEQVIIDPTVKPVKIATTGEYYAVLEPFYNLDVERVLGKLGAEVHRTIMLGDWLKFALILEALGFRKSKVDKAAKPYLHWNVGGEGLVTIGQTVLHAQKGFSGIVELLPFTCIPEITALNILPKIQRELNIPVISFILDEQSGQAGIRTRLEAFVDLLYRRNDANVPSNVNL